jgi:hypothetical protein
MGKKLSNTVKNLCGIFRCSQNERCPLNVQRTQRLKDWLQGNKYNSRLIRFKRNDINELHITYFVQTLTCSLRYLTKTECTLLALPATNLLLSNKVKETFYVPRAVTTLLVGKCRQYLDVSTNTKDSVGFSQIGQLLEIWCANLATIDWLIDWSTHSTWI